MKIVSETAHKIVVTNAYAKEFLDTYYLPERYTGRGEDYAMALLRSFISELKTYGEAWISHHDSIPRKVIILKQTARE